MRHYPLFMDLKERRALVVGSGEVAERKAEALRRCGALVDIHPAFDSRELDALLRWLDDGAPARPHPTGRPQKGEPTRGATRGGGRFDCNFG